MRCYLKHCPSSSTTNPCDCSGQIRNTSGCPAPGPAPAPPAGAQCSWRAPTKAPPGAKNVLYILVDDLRPSLSPYGQKQVYTPNVKKLADTGTVFLRAYCQEAVCSPSRNSFLSGRRPDHTRAWNFINHFRQADTGLEVPGKAVVGASPVAAIRVASTAGAAGECGTQCTTDPLCRSWTYFAGNSSCALHAAPLEQARLADAEGAVSGRAGDLSQPTSWNWTALPQAFQRMGFLTQGTGKIYHTEEGGKTACWNGEGMPPNQDPISWTPGGSMACVNCVAPMVGCSHPVRALGHGCAENATIDGELRMPGGTQLCDKVILDDGLAKLQRASQALNSTGQPFFLAVGFRKPHTPWRFPAAYLQYYELNTTDTALHNVLDKSVPPIAVSSFDFQNPYAPMDPAAAESNRMAYYAAVSWMDHQLGRLLDGLESLGANPGRTRNPHPTTARRLRSRRGPRFHSLADDTVVVMHADHGWSLGEHGQWQKFTNWEAGVRVPLIIRDPYLPQSAGHRSTALAELVDVFPTLLDLAGLDPLAGEQLDGASLGPLLRDPTLPSTNHTGWALSQYPRCPMDLSNPADFYENNKCEFVERSEIPFMGYSLRVDAWRYTEWATWDGARLRPDWTKLAGTELYAHEAGDTAAPCDEAVNACFDRFENVNVAKEQPEVVAQLSAQLHALVAAQFPDDAGP